MNAVIILCLLLSWPVTVWTADANVGGQTRLPDSFRQEIAEIDRIIDQAKQKKKASQDGIAAEFSQEIAELDWIIEQAIQEKAHKREKQDDRSE